MQDIIVKKKSKYQEPEQVSSEEASLKLSEKIEVNPESINRIMEIDQKIDPDKKEAKASTVKSKTSIWRKISNYFISLIMEEDQLTIINQSTGINSEIKVSKIQSSINTKKDTEESRSKQNNNPKKVNYQTLCLATLNVFTLVIMCGYIIYDRNSLKSTPRTASDSVKNSEIRTYLPGASAVNTTSFNEKEYAQIAQDNGTKVQAWLTPWNIDELSTNIDNYSAVSAFWISVNSDGINLTPKTGWETWNKFQQLNKEKNNIPTYLTVTGDPNYTSISISDPNIQKQHIQQLLKVVNEQNFDGIDIDYEALGSENRDVFSNFIENLTNVFHASNKKVSVTLEARIAGQYPMDWQKIGSVADEVRIMAYDYHGRNTGFPGPISPLGWIKEILDYTKNNMDMKKVVIGLGNYGYDWQVNGTENWTGTGISYDQAVNLAKEKNTPIIRVGGIDERGYDIGSTPSFTYKDEQDIQHSVWFEDKESQENKINLINQYSIKGIIFWSVGLGDKNFWQSLNSN